MAAYLAEYPGVVLVCCLVHIPDGHYPVSPAVNEATILGLKEGQERHIGDRKRDRRDT